MVDMENSQDPVAGNGDESGAVTRTVQKEIDAVLVVEFGHRRQECMFCFAGTHANGGLGRSRLMSGGNLLFCLTSVRE